MENSEKLRSILLQTVSGNTLKKIILSRPFNKSVLRAECRKISLKGKLYIQIETFTSDGKAFHRNISISTAVNDIMQEFIGYRQMNILTTGGEAEAKLSSKGKLSVVGKIRAGEPVDAETHDRKKRHILSDGTPYDFLIALNATDAEGLVFDKKRSKYRQIDRFLNYIEDIYPKLSQNGTLHVLDLCCGKSYLSFAVYWYLTTVKKRTISMVGADRKADVIAFCSDISQKLGYSGIKFICCDISAYQPEQHPDLVLSLHACDIATDIVLTTAARLQADVILSTPCCQHQLMSQVNTDSFLGAKLSPILEHSLLKQKFCVALTDALRCKRLQAFGYSVDVTELIDPENTPKNLMIRAIRSPMSDLEKSKHLQEFKELQALCGTDIYGEI